MFLFLLTNGSALEPQEYIVRDILKLYLTKRETIVGFTFVAFVRPQRGFIFIETATNSKNAYSGFFFR